MNRLYRQLVMIVTFSCAVIVGCGKYFCGAHNTRAMQIVWTSVTCLAVERPSLCKARPCLDEPAPLQVKSGVGMLDIDFEKRLNRPGVPGNVRKQRFVSLLMLN